jgi:hypothetical protein
LEPFSSVYKLVLKKNYEDAFKVCTKLEEAFIHIFLFLSVSSDLVLIFQWHAGTISYRHCEVSFTKNPPRDQPKDQKCLLPLSDKRGVTCDAAAAPRRAKCSEARQVDKAKNIFQFKLRARPWGIRSETVFKGSRMQLVSLARDARR